MRYGPGEKIPDYRIEPPEEVDVSELHERGMREVVGYLREALEPLVDACCDYESVAGFEWNELEIATITIRDCLREAGG